MLCRKNLGVFCTRLDISLEDQCVAPDGFATICSICSLATVERLCSVTDMKISTLGIRPIAAISRSAATRRKQTYADKVDWSRVLEAEHTAHELALPTPKAVDVLRFVLRHKYRRRSAQALKPARR
jgi:hypothetical protein